jgi:PAS domain S-box-containing protein
LHRILPLLLEQSIRLCDADGGEIFVSSENGPELFVLTGRDIASGACNDGAENPIPRPLVDWLSQRNEIVHISGKEADPRFAIPGTLLAHPTTLLCFPLRREQQTIGLLILWHKGERRFRQEEIEQVSVIADISRFVVSDMQVLAQTDQALLRRTKELSMLLAATTAFASLQSVAELVETLCWNILESVGSTFCRIYLLEQGREVTIRAACAIRDLSWEPGVGRSFSLESLSRHRQAVVGGEPVILTEDDSGDLDQLEQSLVFCCGNQSALLMPLAVRGRSLGIIVLGEMRSRDKNPYSEMKIAMCRAMALQGALALENMRAIESIAHQNEQIALLTKSVADGILVVDSEGEIQFLNPAAERMLGRSADQVLGRDCRDVLHPAHNGHGEACEPDCPVRNAKAALSSSTFQFKEWITRSDGTAVLVNHNMSPFADVSKEATGLISIFRDVTREEEMNRLRSDFVSLVSHEIRAPLTKITASAELLAKRQLDEPTRQRMVEVLNKESKYLAHIVDEVLQSSRLDEGGLELSFEPLCLGPLIEQIVDMHRSRYSDYDFETQIPAQPLFALGDLVSVQVILENLLQNAVNYSEPGSVITATLTERGDHAVVGIIDQGVGIPKDKLGMIFERYRRFTETGRKVPGFGLGLYITKKLVEAQQGRIWVASELGHGSRFYFSLKKLGGPDGEGSNH